MCSEKRQVCREEAGRKQVCLEEAGVQWEEAGVQRGSRCAQRRQGWREEAGRRQVCRGKGQVCREETGQEAGVQRGSREEAGVPRGGRGVRLLSHWAAVFPAREVQFPAQRRLSGRPFREPGMRLGRSWEVEAAPAVGAEESKRKSCWCKGLFGRKPLAPQRGDSWNKGKSWNCSNLGSEEGPGPGRVGDASCGQGRRRGVGHARGWFCRRELKTG